MLGFRMATEEDVNLLFQWANDKVARENSYNQAPIEFEKHVRWFTEKVNSPACSIYIFTNEQNVPIGQVRFEKDIDKREAIIGIVVDADERGKGYSSEMLKKASADFLGTNSGYKILAYILKQNQPSYNSFIKAGYKLLREDIIKSFPSFIL